MNARHLHFTSLPNVYIDDAVISSEGVLAWLAGRMAGDHIEDVNMGMLDRLVAGVQPGMDPLFSKTFT